MSELQGGCACGKVRYRITAPLIGVGVCHCRACQYASGGGPNYAALAPRGALEVTEGQPKVFTQPADSGNDVGRAFCGDCGTPLFSTPGGASPIQPVRLGSLDDPSGYTPMAHVYTEAAQPWHLMHDGLPQFAKMPPMPA